MHEVIKSCKTHGDLILDQCIKARINKDGSQAYRCKLCMQELHRKHYEKHKDKVLETKDD